MIVELVLQLIPFLLCLLMNESAAAASSYISLAKPNCQDRCGDVTNIAYPFGIGKDCYQNPWYEISCNDSFKPHKPFLTRFNLEVLNVSLKPQNLTVKTPITSICQSDYFEWLSTNFSGSPFLFSSLNKFTVTGCDNAILSISRGITLAGCSSICTNINATAILVGCYGISCCQSSIPFELDAYVVSRATISNLTAANCTYAFLLDPDYLTPGTGSTPLSEVSDEGYAPVVLEWSVTDLSVPVGDFSDYNCKIVNGSFRQSGSRFYSCDCKYTYLGNPYILHGCQVVKECANCKGKCSGGPSEGEFSCNNSGTSAKEIILGVCIATGGSLLLLLGSFWLYKVTRKMKKTKRKEKFFENLLLQHQILSNEGTVERTKIFSSKELKKATDNFNQNRILGQGGQGTVYKGMLIDGKIIAIKKSKLVDESQFEEFINEVVILSQLNHRNVLKLLGCCLETDVPLLVYEFVSNGNLFELIHDQNEEFPLSWEMRLQIAIDVAGAVAYLHSASTTPIYHRDIKSTNILLNDKYRAKVSDFGTSRSISIDQTHVTTLVKGTFGYLDPEYFQSSQFTEKSDVYSFGVVLAELLTGQKPISSIRSQEERSLATHFILSLQENRLFEILDARVMKEGGKEEIMAVANLAKWCLNPNGKNRPTMTEVTMKLEGIRRSQPSHMPLNCQQNFEQDEFNAELMGPSDGASVSTSSYSNPSTGAFSLDFHPLL